MKKLRIFGIICIALSALLLFASCGGAAGQTNDDASDEDDGGIKLTDSFIGSYSTTNAMGLVVSGHLINLYSDGSVKIYYGIKAGMQGHHYGVYTGTLSDGTIIYTYTKADTTEVSEDSFELDPSSDGFKAKIFCLASYPNSSGGGIDYVRIPATEPDLNADYIYIGSKVGDDGNTLAVSDEVSELRIDFNDTTYISYTPDGDNSFPRIPMASIVNADGTRDN